WTATAGFGDFVEPYVFVHSDADRANVRRFIVVMVGERDDRPALPGGMAGAAGVSSRRLDGSDNRWLQDIERMKPVTIGPHLDPRLLTVDGRLVRNAHPPSHHQLEGTMARRLCFGIREGGWQQKDYDGVEFVATVRERNGKETTVLRETMHPTQGSIRVPRACRDLPAAARTGTLELVTNAMRTGAYDWAYW